MLGFHLDDLANIDDDERKQLHGMFEKEGFDNDHHVVYESHISISPDTSHGYAMVQHFNNTFVVPYIAQNAPTMTQRHAWSDGACSQYKGLYSVVESVVKKLS